MDKLFSAARRVIETSSERGRWKVWLLAGVVSLSVAGCQLALIAFGLKPADAEYIVGIIFDGPPKLSSQSVRDQKNAAGPPTLGTYTPRAAFLGNQTAIVGGAIGTSSAPTGAILVREANCTLTQYGIGNVNGTMSTITATLPNADAYLHKLSGLTTTAGTFPKGCADRTKGIPSAPGVYLGQAANGDLLSAATDSGKITLFRFTALGVPVSQTVLVSSSAAPTLAAADLNGDGIADIVTPLFTSGGATGIGVFLSRADGTFNPVTVYAVYPSTVTGATVGIEDVNGDGKLDIVGVGGSFTGSTSVVTLIGAGNGTFAPGPSGVKAIDANAFVLADFNGDGRVDLLTSRGNYMPGNGDGSFGTPVQRLNVFESGVARNLAVGDFDGDGKVDVALRDGNIVTILLGRGDGTFAIKASYAAVRGADYLSVTDIDGDGNADIVVGLTGPKVYGPNLRSQTVTQFMLGRGDGTFAAAQAIPGVGTSLSSGAPLFVLADFNGDGFPDLVARSSTGNFSTLVLQAGTASGNFASETSVATFAFRPELVASGDVDGDGKADLVVGGTQLAVLKGMGNGVFAPAQIYNLPGADSDPRDLVNLAVADFNGDGRADVLVVRGKQSGTTGGAFVYFANADGTLKAPVQIDNANNLRAVAVGDLNGDGRADIALGGLDPQFYTAPTLAGIRIYRGNADGSFSSPLTLNPGVTYAALAIGDMNKDGKKDLVVASNDKSLNDTVFVLPGLGDGTFGAATSFPLPGGGPGIASIAIGDFNSDGNVDVMFAGGFYSGFLVGGGDGSLSGSSAVTIASGASYVVAADLNKDAKMDAVVAVANQGLVPLVQTVSAITPVPPPAADFTIAITSNSGSVSSGQSAQTVLNLAFGTGFTQTVTFNCAGLPANARCSFNPASVTPGSGAPSTTVTISTGGVLSAWLGGGFGSADTMTWGFVGIGSIGLAAIVRRKRRMTWRAAAMLFFAGLVAIGLGSCGGDDGNGVQSAAPPSAITMPAMPTPVGTYTVTISATAGAVTKTVVYALTVK